MAELQKHRGRDISHQSSSWVTGSSLTRKKNWQQERHLFEDEFPREAYPVDILKIDQSFVRDMLEDKGDMAIVHGILALAKAFERNTVAEGIETEQQYLALLEMGCKLGQGYGIARPMPADDLIRWQTEFFKAH